MKNIVELTGDEVWEAAGCFIDKPALSFKIFVKEREFNPNPPYSQTMNFTGRLIELPLKDCIFQLEVEE